MARRRKNEQTPGVVAYIRVSTDEQAASGAGLQAQRSAIEAECERRGLELLQVFVEEGKSAGNLNRPALTDALRLLDDGGASVLMVSKLDRLTRSVHDATGLMRRSEKAGWGIVSLDAAVDTTTPQGAAMVQMLGVFAELERNLIGQRTKDALAARRAQGVQLGRRSTLPAKVVKRIIRERDAGASWPAIADGLNADKTPTAQGGAKWHPTTVRNIYNRTASTDA